MVRYGDDHKLINKAFIAFIKWALFQWEFLILQLILVGCIFFRWNFYWSQIDMDDYIFYDVTDIDFVLVFYIDIDDYLRRL